MREKTVTAEAEFGEGFLLLELCSSKYNGLACFLEIFLVKRSTFPFVPEKHAFGEITEIIMVMAAMT